MKNKIQGPESDLFRKTHLEKVLPLRTALRLRNLRVLQVVVRVNLGCRSSEEGPPKGLFVCTSLGLTVRTKE